MADDYTSTISTTGAVAVDGSKRGEIEDTNDRGDWFQVVLVEGQTYQIDVKGSPTGNGTLDDPKLIGLHDVEWQVHPRHGERRRRRGLKQPDHVHGAG